MSKKYQYCVQIHNWNTFHSCSTKSSLSDERGYFESSSLMLSGDLWAPKIKSVQQTSIEFIEDNTNILNRECKIPSSVGLMVFDKNNSILTFRFFISSCFFDRISLSLNSDKIEHFIAHGEKLKNDYATVFEFALKS